MKKEKRRKYGRNLKIRSRLEISKVDYNGRYFLD